MLNLLYVTSKFQTTAMFVYVDLQKVRDATDWGSHISFFLEEGN
jgi:hypothetical protein